MKKVLKAISVFLAITLIFTLAACASDPDTPATPSTPDTPDAPAQGSGGQEASPPAAAGDGIHLTWWGLEAQADGLDEVIAAFEAQNPGITIAFSGHSNESLHQNLQISAMNNTLPSMWFMWGGALGGRYVQYGVTRDLTEYARANNWDQKFTAASLELCTLHGELAGFPRVVNALVVYYRKDIFENLGLSVPTTIDQFHSNAEAIHAAGIIPINTASVPGWHIMRLWEQFLEHYAGPTLHDQLQIFAVPWEGNQAVINSFTTFQRYAESGFFPDGFISMEAGDLVMLLYPGHAAMQIEGQWWDSVINADEQDISLYGFFPFPNGGTNRVSAFGEMFQINDNVSDAELDAIMKFLDFFFQQQNVEAHPGLYGLPIPQIGREGGIPAENVNVPGIFAAANANGAFTISDQALPPIVCDALFTVLDELALSRMTPAEAASFMQRAIERHDAEG